MSEKNKAPTDQISKRVPTITLVNFLELLGFNSSHYGIKLHSDIFKNPDKELFRKIMCFILQTIGGFENWLAIYSTPIVATKVEAQFRSSIKEVLMQINQTWPKANLKLINQSFLVAPQGMKIISFLLSLCKFAVILVCERCGESYVNPSEEELDVFLKETVDCDSVLHKLECQIEELTIKIESNSAKEIISKIELISFIDSNETLNPALKDKLKIIENIDDTVSEWKKNIQHNLEAQQRDVKELELLSKHTFELKKLFDELVKFQNTYLDGIEIMKELGFKSNANVNIKGIDLVVDGKLNFLSLLKYFNVHLKVIHGINFNSTVFENSVSDVKKLLKMYSEECKAMEIKKRECESLINTYEPLVRQFCESTEAKNAIATNNILQTIYECEKNKKQIIINDEKEMLVVPDFALPAVENLAQWIVGETGDACKKSSLASGRKNRSFRASPSLGQKSSRKRQNLLMKKSEKFNEGCKRPIFGLAPLIGSRSENRRVTLASPQMARRECFRAQRIDEKRKPLKPMKALFTASSPLSESTRSLHSEKTTSFGEQSKVDTAEEFLLELPSTSSVINSFNSPKHNSLNFQPVISTPELQQWDRSSSESDFSCSPTAAVPPPCLSPDHTSDLNDSTLFLIEKFKAMKSNLNISN